MCMSFWNPSLKLLRMGEGVKWNMSGLRLQSLVRFAAKGIRSDTYVLGALSSKPMKVLMCSTALSQVCVIFM